MTEKKVDLAALVNLTEVELEEVQGGAIAIPIDSGCIGCVKKPVPLPQGEFIPPIGSDKGS